MNSRQSTPEDITSRMPFAKRSIIAWFGSAGDEAAVMVAELSERFTILASGMPNRPGTGEPPPPPVAPEDEEEEAEAK